MRLLFLSTIRHIRKHFFQTIITFLITFIFVSMLSAIFHFAIGFQGALRQYAIDTVGTYHYKWIGKQEELGFMEGIHGFRRFVLSRKIRSQYFI